MPITPSPDREVRPLVERRDGEAGCDLITGHRRSVSAPQAVNATAISKRTGYAIGTSGSGTASRLSTMKRTNAAQVPGAMATVTATIAAVAPSATAELPPLASDRVPHERHRDELRQEQASGPQWRQSNGRHDRGGHDHLNVPDEQIADHVAADEGDQGETRRQGRAMRRRGSSTRTRPKSPL